MCCFCLSSSEPRAAAERQDSQCGGCHALGFLVCWFPVLCCSFVLLCLLRPAHLCSFAPPHTCLTSPAPRVSPPAAPPLLSSVCLQSVSFSRPHVSPVSCFHPVSSGSSWAPRVLHLFDLSFVLVVFYCWNYLDYLYRQLFSHLPFWMFGSPGRFSSFIKASLFVVNLPVSAFQLLFSWIWRVAIQHSRKKSCSQNVTWITLSQQMISSVCDEHLTPDWDLCCHGNKMNTWSSCRSVRIRKRAGTGVVELMKRLGKWLNYNLEHINLFITSTSCFVTLFTDGQIHL